MRKSNVFVIEVLCFFSHSNEDMRELLHCTRRTSKYFSNYYV